MGTVILKAPSNASASALSQTQIDIGWQDNSPNETAFEVQRSTAGPSGSFDVIAMPAANVRTYGDKNLVPATQYCYRVRAFRGTPKYGTTFSEFSNTTCATTPPPLPDAASGAKVVASISSGVTVSWSDNSTNEDGFRVYRSVDGLAGWTLAATLAANTTAWVTDQAACYRVVAFNVGGDAAPSNAACAIPAPASAVTAIPSSATSVTIAWTDNAPNEDGFRIYRSADGNVWTLGATVGANVVSWVTNQPVCYRVVAFNAHGEAPPSNVACALAASVYQATTVESSSTSATVSWTDNSTNENGFRIYRSSDGLTGWTLATTVAPNTTSWITNQLVCYRVAPFNAAGEAPPSNVACTVPAAPTNVDLRVLQADAFQLTWTDNSAIEDGYQVIQIVNNWCAVGSVGCNAGGTEPEWSEAVLATLPANSTSFILGRYVMVVDSFTECDCVYVVATKSWGVASAALSRQRRTTALFRALERNESP